MASKIQSVLLDLENSQSIAKREQLYIELTNILKQDDEITTLNFMKAELWRFLKVFTRDIEEEELFESRFRNVSTLTFFL